MQDAKGERFVFHQLTKGQLATEALAEKLPEVITNIHFPKIDVLDRQRRRALHPAHSMDCCAPRRCKSFHSKWPACKSGNTTRGHRILGSKEPLPVTVATYLEILESNFVIVHAEERKAAY